MDYDILLRGDGSTGYEVLEINTSKIESDQLQVGEFLSDSEVDDLLQMGFIVEFKEFQ